MVKPCTNFLKCNAVKNKICCLIYRLSQKNQCQINIFIFILLQVSIFWGWASSNVITFHLMISVNGRKVNVLKAPIVGFQLKSTCICSIKTHKSRDQRGVNVTPRGVELFGSWMARWKNFRNCFEVMLKCLEYLKLARVLM